MVSQHLIQSSEELVAEVRELLQSVYDPEIPTLNIQDLGLLRDVAFIENSIVVTITPSYSGCPAMRTIENDIKTVLAAAGFTQVSVETQLAPAWSTDFISEQGRQRLLEAGIAPPQFANAKTRLRGDSAIACPQCRSVNTELLSVFGSTACKALYRCLDCREPFDYFKCL